MVLPNTEIIISTLSPVYPRLTARTMDSLKFCGEIWTPVISFFHNVYWPPGIWSILIICVIFLAGRLLGQIPFPENAPNLVNEGYPGLGMLRFVYNGYQFFVDGSAMSKSGNFSFYCGKHQVVGLSGRHGRQAFFESKSLDLAKG